MEKREIKICDSLHVDGMTLIPIIEICLQYWFDNKNISCFYLRKPVMVLAVSEHVKKAIHISGEEVPLDELCELVPDIDRIVNPD